MIFLNKQTGLSWEITDEEHIKRLLRDKDYEVLNEEIEKEKVTSIKKTNSKKQVK